MALSTKAIPIQSLLLLHSGCVIDKKKSNMASLTSTIAEVPITTNPLAILVVYANKCDYNLSFDRTKKERRPPIYVSTLKISGKEFVGKYHPKLQEYQTVKQQKGDDDDCHDYFQAEADKLAAAEACKAFGLTL
jgi:hypothetical protein